MNRVRGAAQRQLTRSRGAPSLGCECEALGGKGRRTDPGLGAARRQRLFSHSSHVPAPPSPRQPHPQDRLSRREGNYLPNTLAAPLPLPTTAWRSAALRGGRVCLFARAVPRAMRMAMRRVQEHSVPVGVDGSVQNGGTRLLGTVR
jgi:hypothetical protein